MADIKKSKQDSQREPLRLLRVGRILRDYERQKASERWSQQEAWQRRCWLMEQANAQPIEAWEAYDDKADIFQRGLYYILRYGWLRSVEPQILNRLSLESWFETCAKGNDEDTELCDVPAAHLFDNLKHFECVPRNVLYNMSADQWHKTVREGLRIAKPKIHDVIPFLQESMKSKYWLENPMAFERFIRGIQKEITNKDDKKLNHYVNIYPQSQLREAREFFLLRHARKKRRLAQPSQ